MKYIKNHYEFITEKVIEEFKKSIDEIVQIEAGEHFNNRLTRIDGELPEVTVNEVITDIKTALNRIMNRIIFNSGLFWKDKNKLNKPILIKNTQSNLNIIIEIEKIKDIRYKFNIIIKTIMRKSNFVVSAEYRDTEIIKI